MGNCEIEKCEIGKLEIGKLGNLKLEIGNWKLEIEKLGNWEIGKLGNWEIGNWKLEIGKLGNWEIGKLGNWKLELGNWKLRNWEIGNFKYTIIMAKKTAYIVKVQVSGKTQIDHLLHLKKKIITGVYFNHPRKRAKERAIEDIKKAIESGNVTLREYDVTYKVLSCKGIRFDFVQAAK